MVTKNSINVYKIELTLT